MLLSKPPQPTESFSSSDIQDLPASTTDPMLHALVQATAAAFAASQAGAGLHAAVATATALDAASAACPPGAWSLFHLPLLQHPGYLPADYTIKEMHDVIPAAMVHNSLVQEIIVVVTFSNTMLDPAVPVPPAPPGVPPMRVPLYPLPPVVVPTTYAPVSVPGESNSG